MKALVGALLALALVAPALAQAAPICGEVVLGQCDVDYCHFKFFVTLDDHQTKWEQYGLSLDGEYINHDYELTPALEQMVGKKFCADTSDISSIGSIEVSKLQPVQQ